MFAAAVSGQSLHPHTRLLDIASTELHARLQEQSLHVLHWGGPKTSSNSPAMALLLPCSHSLCPGPGCGFPACIQHLLLCVLSSRNVGCSWEGACSWGVARGTTRSHLQVFLPLTCVSLGTAHPSPDPSSPCKGQDGKVRDEAPAPLRSSWLLAETAN